MQREKAITPTSTDEFDGSAVAALASVATQNVRANLRNIICKPSGVSGIAELK
jgi:hypothetical protein